MVHDPSAALAEWGEPAATATVAVLAVHGRGLSPEWMREASARFAAAPTRFFALGSQPSRSSASTAATGTSIVAYEWDFNDGTAKVTGAASVVKHTFADGPAAVKYVFD